MASVSITLEFDTLNEDSLRSRLAPVLDGQAANVQRDILDGLTQQMETETGLSYDILSGSVSGEVDYEVPDDVAEQFQVDPLTEESVTANANEEISSDFDVKLNALISELVGT